MCVFLAATALAIHPRSRLIYPGQVFGPAGIDYGYACGMGQRTGDDLKEACKGQLHRSFMFKPSDSPRTGKQPKPATKFPMTRRGNCPNCRAGNRTCLFAQSGPLFSGREVPWSQKGDACGR